MRHRFLPATAGDRQAHLSESARYGGASGCVLLPPRVEIKKPFTVGESYALPHETLERA
jgi:hypothetical protein